MELDANDRARQGRLMAAPSMVFTAKFAASSFGVDVEVIEELAEQMEPEDGRLSVIDSLDEAAESVRVHAPRPRLPRRSPRRPPHRVRERQLTPPRPSPDGYQARGNDAEPASFDIRHRMLRSGYGTTACPPKRGAGCWSETQIAATETSSVAENASPQHAKRMRQRRSSGGVTRAQLNRSSL